MAARSLNDVAWHRRAKNDVMYGMYRRRSEKHGIGVARL